MSAFFPAAVATQLQLLTAQNNSMVVLDADCDLDDVVLTVDDASALPTSGYLTFVDTDEVIHYSAKTSNTLTGVVRGADSTTPLGHIAGVDLEQRWNADYHNIVTLEMVAVEQFLSDKIGLSTTQVIAPAGSVSAPAYTTLGDLDTGLYHSGANVLDIATGGTRAASWNSSQQLQIYKTTNQVILGTTNTLTISSTAPASSRTYTIPDSGVSSNFLLSGWAQIVNADVSASAAIAYSKLALTGAILNADLAGSIAYSKLTLTGAILNADLAGSIAYSKLTLTTSIVNGDIGTSAAIARSKLAALTASRAMVTDGSGFDSASSVTATELGYLSGVTSAIQTQINALTGGGYLLLTGGTVAGNLIVTNAASSSPIEILDSTNTQSFYIGMAGGAASDVVLLSANRRTDGTYKKTGQAACSIILTADSGDGNLTFYTTPTNNSALTLALTIDKNQRLLAADGAVGTPEYSFANDPDCGMYRIGANDISLAVAGVNTLELTAANTVYVRGVATDAAYAGPLFISAGNGSTFGVSIFTKSVTTSSVLIMNQGWSGLMLVTGDNGTATFTDLIIVFVNGTQNIVGSYTQRGSPAARTYTSGVGTINLQMASGTYSVQSICLAASGR